MVIFIIVVIAIILITVLLKEAGIGAGAAVGGLAIYFLYKAMFKKEKPKATKDITLNK